MELAQKDKSLYATEQGLRAVVEQTLSFQGLTDNRSLPWFPYSN